MNPSIGTVALVVHFCNEKPVLVDVLSDDKEIEMLDSAITTGAEDPLGDIYQARNRQASEDEEFGDYVEELLSQPYLKPDLKDQGIRWLKSRIKIEEYERCETEARQIIADYAYRLFEENPKRKEFVLSGPKAKVRIRILKVPKAAISLSRAA